MRVKLIKPVFIAGRVHAPGEEIEVAEEHFSATCMERLDARPEPAPQAPRRRGRPPKAKLPEPEEAQPESEGA